MTLGFHWTPSPLRPRKTKEQPLKYNIQNWVYKYTKNGHMTLFKHIRGLT